MSKFLTFMFTALIASSFVIPVMLYIDSYTQLAQAKIIQ